MISCLKKPFNCGYAKKAIGQNSLVVTNRMTTTANMGLFLLIIISRSDICYIVHTTHSTFVTLHKFAFLILKGVVGKIQSDKLLL